METSSSAKILVSTPKAPIVSTLTAVKKRHGDCQGEHDILLGEKLYFVCSKERLEEACRRTGRPERVPKTF